MPQISFSELPEDLRVKLTEDGKQELWHRVDEFGGVKSLSEAFDYSQSKMYNWKNKDLALPVGFVRKIMGENNTDEVKVLKGKGSSGKIKNPEFPLAVKQELLTRINISVNQNNDGTPVYIASEQSLIQRFAELLKKLGDVEHTVYSRESRFELRYPKFLHYLIIKLDYSPNMTALVDEKARIEDGEILLDNQKIPVENFDQKLFSREKRFELALQRGESEMIAEMMAEESEKVKRVFDR